MVKMGNYLLCGVVVLLLLPAVAISASFEMLTFVNGVFYPTYASSTPFTQAYVGTVPVGTNASWDINSNARADYLSFGIQGTYTLNVLNGNFSGGAGTTVDYNDSWTVNGATGSGILRLTVNLDGTFGGDWGLKEQYGYQFSYYQNSSWVTTTFIDGAWLRNPLTTNGDYAVNQPLEFDIPFTFGTPLPIYAGFGVNPYPVYYISGPGTTTAYFDFFHTAAITGIEILDGNQNPVYGTTVLASDNTLLATQQQPSAVPEPASLLLLGTGLGAIGLAALRRKKA